MNLQWPLISRRAFDLVIEERDQLQKQTVPLQTFEVVVAERDRIIKQNDELLEHLKRMDRVDHGVGEVPRKPRPELEPMPKELREYLDGFADPNLRREQKNTAYRQHARGTPWDDIIADVIPKEGEKET